MEMPGFGSLFIIAGCYILVYTFGKINKKKYSLPGKFREARKTHIWNKK